MRELSTRQGVHLCPQLERSGHVILGVVCPCSAVGLHHRPGIICLSIGVLILYVWIRLCYVCGGVLVVLGPCSNVCWYVEGLYSTRALCHACSSGL